MDHVQRCISKAMSSSVNMNSLLELFASDNVTRLVKHFY